MIHYSRTLFLLAALFLVFALPVHAYEIPEVCFDARDMEKTDNPDLSEIIELYTQCLEGDLDPVNRAIGYNNRGWNRYNMGDLDGAIEDYDQAISLSPESAEIYGNRAFAHHKKGNADKARADARKARELDPATEVPTFD